MKNKLITLNQLQEDYNKLLQDKLHYDSWCNANPDKYEYQYERETKKKIPNREELKRYRLMITKYMKELEV